MEMERFDYVFLERLTPWGEAIREYMIFDRERGCTVSLARCENRDDAEAIVAALNVRT